MDHLIPRSSQATVIGVGVIEGLSLEAAPMMNAADHVTKLCIEDPPQEEATPAAAAAAEDSESEEAMGAELRPDLLPRPEPRHRSKDERLAEMEAIVRRAEVAEEFGGVPLKRASAGTSTAARPDVADRNRFPNILPYEDSRLRLTPSKANPHGYINASLIHIPLGSGRDLRYVATQAPLQATAEDFWQAVWETRASVIVALTRTHEKGAERCHQYWPSKSEGKSKLKFGDFSVSLSSSTASKSQVASTLCLKHSPSGTRRVVYHLQFLPWPVGGVPANVETFLRFLDEVSSVRRHAENEAGRGGNGAEESRRGVGPKRRSVSTGRASLSSSAHSSASSASSGGSWTRRVLGSRNGSLSLSLSQEAAESTEPVEETPPPPLFVHCSSGAGRTGVFLLCHLAMAALDHNQELPLPRALSLLRQQRMRLVQSPAQYHFVYDALIAYLANSRLI